MTMTAIAAAARLNVSGWTETSTLERRPDQSEAELSGIIRAVYRQLFGNDHLFGADVEDLASAESLLRRNNLTVKEFVRLVAKSGAYKRRFLYPNSQTRAIELNFKHLLGRAPATAKDIADHLDLYQNKGHEGEVDSYLDSAEYAEAFGDNIVPYPRGFQTRKGQVMSEFPNSFNLYQGYASNDRAQGRQPRIYPTLATGLIPAIRSEAYMQGAPSGRHLGPPTGRSSEMFCVEVTGLLNPPANLATSETYRRANQRFFVAGNNLSATLQRILRSGGRVVSVRRA